MRHGDRASQRRDVGQVEGAARAGGFGQRECLERAVDVAVQLADVRKARVGGQARPEREQLLDRARRVVVVAELDVGVDEDRERVGIEGI